jgi:hypothetical protein
MIIETGSSHITPADGNVFADLGFEPEEAARLLAESEKKIAELQANKDAEVIRLSFADQECFAQALLSPPRPAPALKRSFARRSKLLRAE